MEAQVSIERYFSDLQEMVEAISRSHLQDIVTLLEETYHHGRRIFIMGNGGSAATASHFAWSNDTAYEYIFAEQLVTMLEPGDAVIGISASGNSLNIINALKVAKETHAATIAFLGAHGGRIRHMVDAYVLAPGQNIEQEEDAHLMMAHIMTRHMREVVRCYAQQLAIASAHGIGSLGAASHVLETWYNGNRTAQRQRSAWYSRGAPDHQCDWLKELGITHVAM